VLAKESAPGGAVRFNSFPTYRLDEAGARLAPVDARQLVCQPHREAGKENGAAAWIHRDCSVLLSLRLGSFHI
jgi:hypothetical protein